MIHSIYILETQNYEVLSNRVKNHSTEKLDSFINHIFVCSVDLINRINQNI